VRGEKASVASGARRKSVTTRRLDKSTNPRKPISKTKYAERCDALTKTRLPSATGHLVFFSFLLFLGIAVAGTGFCYSTYFMSNVAQRLRALTIQLVFTKTLDRGSQNFDASEALNLIATDSQRWLECIPMLNQGWSAPTMLVVSAFWLFRLVGNFVWCAVGVLGVCGPLIMLVGRETFRARKKRY